MAAILVNLLLTLIILGIIYWLVTFIPLPSPFPQIVQGLFIILAIVVILSALGVIPGGGLHLRLM